MIVSEAPVRPSKPRSLRGRWRNTSVANKIAVVCTSVIATANIAFVIVAGIQLYEIKSSSADTHALAVNAGKQADAAKALADQATLQGDKMAESLRKTDTLIEQAIAQTKASNSLAAQAKRSADIADRSLSEIRRNFNREQRPWITPTTFKLSSEPEINKLVAVQFGVINTGRTPAVKVTNQSRLSLWDGTPPEAAFPNPDPNDTGTFLAPGDTNLSFTTNIKLVLTTAEQLQGYTSKSTNIYVQAIVRYEDLSSVPVTARNHWTKICAYHISGEPLQRWHLCKQGNGVDNDDQR